MSFFKKPEPPAIRCYDCSIDLLKMNAFSVEREKDENGGATTIIGYFTHEGKPENWYLCNISEECHLELVEQMKQVRTHRLETGQYHHE